MSEQPINEVVPVSSAPASPRSKLLLPISLVAAALALAGVGDVGYQRYHEADQHNNPQHFADGVTVAGVAVGGKTPDEARELVRQWAKAQGAKPVTFTAPQSGKRWNLPLASVGGRFDFDAALMQAFHVGKATTVWQKIMQGGREYTADFTPTFRLNEAALDKQIAGIAKAVDRPAVDARARVTDTGQVTLAAPERKGISLDTAATKAALLQKGPESLRNGGAVTLVVREEMPRITAAALGKMGTVLASYTTDYSSSIPTRRHNVELAASKVNGTLLAPGEVFSYNKVVGPREAEYGWQNALMFEDGEVVPGMGGGVCQPSSTLYNAVLQADLKVVERQNHSIKVTYVRPGRDATVVYGSLDFRFANSTDGPLLILAKMRNRRLTFNLYGTKPTGKKVEIVSGPYRSNDAGGITVATYKVVTGADGKAIREYLHTDVYQSPKAKRDKPHHVVHRERRSSPVIPAASRETAASAPSHPSA